MFKNKRFFELQKSEYTNKKHFFFSKYRHSGTRITNLKSGLRRHTEEINL
jgi:hypothetical protein